MLKRNAAALASICLILLALCSQASAKPVDPELLQAKAAKILENIIDGLAEGDYNLYTKNFSGILKDSLDRESFLKLQRETQKALGKYKSSEYMGFYVQYGSVITLFKAKFTKEKDDVLIKLILDGSGDEAKVTGLWLDTPALEK
jgi:hypothetical protein